MPEHMKAHCDKWLDLGEREVVDAGASGPSRNKDGKFDCLAFDKEVCVCVCARNKRAIKHVNGSYRTK